MNKKKNKKIKGNNKPQKLEEITPKPTNTTTPKTKKESLWDPLTKIFPWLEAIWEWLKKVIPYKALRILLFMFIILGVICFSLRDMIFPLFEEELQPPFSATVHVTNWKEYNEPFLPKLALIIGVEDAQMDKDGKANFINILSDLDGNKVPIKIKETQGMPYELVDDSIIISRNGINQIKVRLRGLEKLDAKVRDFDTKEALSNAYVACADTTVITDELGKFTIYIPPEKQQKEQRVIISKDGYEYYNCFHSFVENSKPKTFDLQKK